MNSSPTCPAALKPLELRALNPTHLPQILNLDQLCFGGLWTQDGYEREMDSPNSELWGLTPGSAEFVTTQAGEATPLLGMGCFWAIVEEAHITLLGIHPAYQRQGLGQLLLYTLLRQAYTRGLERATLEVRASNQSALSLYQKFGFQEAGRRKKYYQDTNEDALVLWLGRLQDPRFQENLERWRSQLQSPLQQSGWQLPSAFANL